MRVSECHSAAEWEDLKLAEQIGLGRQQFNGVVGQAAGELNMIDRGRTFYSAASVTRMMKAAGIAAGLALAAAAAAPGSASTGPDGSKADPDRQICKSKPVVGSRLKRIRECATAEQWEEMKLQEQVGLMRKQVNGDPGCNSGSSPSCNPMRGGGRDTPW